MKSTKRKQSTLLGLACAALLPAYPAATHASSHQDAPLISLDDPANTTDVYAFKTRRDGVDYLQVALGVYPFEFPGVGPNNYRFDDDVLYSIHIGSGGAVGTGETTERYDFRFTTSFENEGTILQSFLGVINAVGDSNQNLRQTYTVTRTVGNVATQLTSTTNTALITPPNNQGFATPLYNIENNGRMAAKPGAVTAAGLDAYTAQSIYPLTSGFRVFAGQREDGFYGDIHAIFDLLQLRAGGPASSFDSQSGFNIHMICLEIPISELGGTEQVVAVHATTSRQATRVLTDGPNSPEPANSGAFVQVGRQGNPLFCEALIAIQDKDLYNRTSPTDDANLFQQYALNPELVTLIDVIVFGDQPGGADTGIPDNRRTNRTDIAGIFIPDTIKVDLSTAQARLANNFANTDPGFRRLGVFGGDVLKSTVQPGFDLTNDGVNNPDGTISGGWPNGRRFGDDVVDIAVLALTNDLRTSPPTIDILNGDGIDNVVENDAIYNKVFPYAGTPFNGRNIEANPLFINPGFPAQP